MVNPFVRKRSENQWVFPLSVMTFVFGLITSLAWIGNLDRTSRVSRLSEEQKMRYSAGNLDLSEDNERLREEVIKLRAENSKLQNAVAENSNASQSLNQSLQEYKLFASLTPVEGPGVAVTLKDVQAKGAEEIASLGEIIHDTDVLRVVNELKNAGAEAVSVNNRRVGPMTNFRCVGTTILVDEYKIASPVVVRAIGDSDTLFGAMNLPGGILDEIRRTDPRMVEVDPVQKMRIPGYSGPTTFKVAQVSGDGK